MPEQQESDDPIRYVIEPANPAAHLYRVKVTVPTPDPAGQAFTLPAWIPGSYLVRDFARSIVAITATADGESVELCKTDKSSWLAAPASGPLTLELEVYACDFSVRGAHLDTTHAYFNGTSVFLAVVGQESTPCDLYIRPAADGTGAGWRVATSMRPAGAERFGYGSYRANDYWELIDHPVEIADQCIGEFEVNGIPHAIAIRGAEPKHLARLLRDLKSICERHHRLLGAPANLDRYLFLLTVVESGYGGLEHRWSSSNLCSRDDLPASDDGAVSPSYRKLLGLLSHEYFHLWNVTRMKPAAFTPYDLSREVHTGLMWVFEGITSYYDDLCLARSGCITPESYLELIGQVVTRVLRSAGRHRQSIEESSFDAWTKFYKQDAGSPNFIVSYYQKGSLVALALDLTLRQRTDDRVSLDDVMRECWARYGQSGNGMPERGLESVAASVSGLDLETFFDQYVRGTGEMPLDELLLAAGVRMNLRAATGHADTGGKPAADDARRLPWFGARLADNDGRTVVGTVQAGSPAEAAGLAPGDEAIALGDWRLTAGNLDGRLARSEPGERLPLTVFRRDELLRLSVELGEAPKDTAWLTIDESADDAAAARRKSWLGS